MYGAPWGASEELWGQAAIELKRRGHDVLASVMWRPRLSERVIELARQGVRVQAQPSFLEGRIRHYWHRVSLGIRRSYMRLKRFHPHFVVISQGDNSGGFEWAKVCREAGIPYAMLVNVNSEHLWFRERYREAVESYTGARRVFCVSRHNLELLRLQLAEMLPNAEIVWVPFNVSTECPPPWPDESGCLLLACLSRLELAAKGQDLLLQILALPEWRNRAVELNLYGVGLDEDVLRRLCSMFQLQSVRFRGHVSDIRAVWGQNHLLLVPSRFEGVPQVLVEAMWCGRPAVVTDMGRMAELCVDNETGFVAPAATVASFSQALERAWERRREWRRLGQAARARAENLIPREPVRLFCDRLIACAARLNDVAG
jgi:glycosyltransferase involved in cell wall biosynthesis